MNLGWCQLFGPWTEVAGAAIAVLLAGAGLVT